MTEDSVQEVKAAQFLPWKQAVFKAAQLHVAYIARFIWYEKFRTWVISPTHPGRHEHQSTFSWFCFITLIRFSFYLSLSTYWCNIRACVLYVCPAFPQNTQNNECWNCSVRLNLCFPLISTTVLVPSFLSTLLCSQMNTDTLDPANSKAISFAGKTTRLMIYSLLILKSEQEEWRDFLRSLIWLLRAFTYPLSPRFPPFSPVPSCVSCCQSDNKKRWESKVCIL